MQIPRPRLRTVPLRVSRRGYSVLELLMVISIIALILSALGVVMANYVQSARLQATRATITKIDAILKQRMNGLRGQDMTDAATKLQRSGAVANLETGRALALKQRLRATFPQQRADLTSGSGVLPHPFDKITNTWVTNHPEAESAAFLYAIVTQGATYGTPSVDDSFFNSREFQTLEDVPVFIDAWGEPLRYYRAPTRLFWLGEDLNGNGSLDVGEDDVDGDGNLTPTTADQIVINQARLILAPSLRFVTDGSFIHPQRIDGDDPLNRLRSLLLTGGPPPAFTPAAWNNFEALFQTPAAYSTPLIISGGPDRELGLLSQTSSVAARRLQINPANSSPSSTLDASDLDFLTDNITNLNSQSQGGN